MVLDMNFYVFLVTVQNVEEAQKIAHLLVENKLAACVNIIHNISSIYEWKGKIEENNEQILIIKSMQEKSEQLIKKINEIHSYENPECIGIRIEKGSEKYLNWIKEVLD